MHPPHPRRCPAKAAASDVRLRFGCPQLVVGMCAGAERLEGGPSGMATPGDVVGGRARRAATADGRILAGCGRWMATALYAQMCPSEIRGRCCGERSPSCKLVGKHRHSSLRHDTRETLRHTRMVAHGEKMQTKGDDEGQDGRIGQAHVSGRAFRVGGPAARAGARMAPLLAPPKFSRTRRERRPVDARARARMASLHLRVAAPIVGHRPRRRLAHRATLLGARMRRVRARDATRPFHQRGRRGASWVVSDPA